jgi:hypothetical protein
LTRAWFDRFPHGWWGYHWAPPQPLSAVEIVGTGSIDTRLMATLWSVVARRRSVILAAEAPMAGKTTTLSALVDFLPSGTVGLFLRGWAEDYSWLDEYPAERSYLLVNEMSDHLPIYLWGDRARLALMLAARGYGLGATMHADSLDEALDVFRDELGAPEEDLTALTIYLQFSAYRTPRGMYRRVEEAWHLAAGADGGLERLRLGAIDGDRSPSLTGAQRLPGPPMLATDGGRARLPFVHDPAAYARLAASLGSDPVAFEAELAARASFLEDLARRGICNVADVAVAIRRYPTEPSAPIHRPEPMHPPDTSQPRSEPA